eukprot:198640_1
MTAETGMDTELDHLAGKDSNHEQHNVMDDSDSDSKSQPIDQSLSRIQRANQSLRDLRNQSLSRITRNQMVETIQFNFFMSVCGIIIFLLVVLTPIGSVIGGFDIINVFDNYSIEDINHQCNGQYDAFTYPTYSNSLAEIGEQIIIVGIVDLCVIFFCGICNIFVFIKYWNDMGEISITCFCIGRSIFMIVYIVYAAFIFDSNNKLQKHCDKNST